MTAPIKRSPMRSRTQPMKRTPLARTKAGKMGALLGQNSSAEKAPQMAPRPVARKQPRDTGPDRKTRSAVIEREGRMCASCGKHLPAGSWRSIQHRVARGVGGGNDLPNLILLCGSATSPGCHLEAEQRTEESHARGYWLRSDENPRLVPVMLFSRHGSGITAWLAADGTYRFDGPDVTP